jgi:hypothetical protein
MLLGSGAAAVEDTSAFAACVEGKSYSRRSEPDPSEPALELALSSLGASVDRVKLLLEALVLLFDALELLLDALVVLTDALKLLLGLPNDALVEGILVAALGILVAALLDFALDLLEEL